MTFLDLTGLTRFLDKVKTFVGGLIGTHNTASDAHSDIRTNVSGLQSEATAKWELLNTVDNRSNTTASGLQAHLTDDNNPHKVVAEQVGADPSGTASSLISTHDSNASAHSILFATKAPTSHAVAASTYGLGTTTLYGHNLLVNGLTQSSYGDGYALSAYQGYLLNTNKAPNDHATSATTYGISTASYYGHAMASSTTPIINGTATLGSETAKFARGDHIHPTDTTRAPNNHQSANATYGIGTGTYYGHVLLSDSTSTTSGTSLGIAATPTAVKSAYDLASSALTAANSAQSAADSANTAATAAQTSANTASNRLGYGTCATAAATTAKVGTLSGFERNTGAVVSLKFTYANTATSPTLNVNSTGAASIYDYRTSTFPASGTMGAGTHHFVFNGTQWVLLNPLSQDVITAAGILLGAGSGSVGAATEGTDYVGIDTNNAGKAKPERISAEIYTVTAATTLSLAHAGCMVMVNSTSAITITIPTNAAVAFPVGTEIEILRYNTGAVTIAAASGVTIVTPASAYTIEKQYNSVCVKKLATNTWLLQGALG